MPFGEGEPGLPLAEAKELLKPQNPQNSQAFGLGILAFPFALGERKWDFGPSFSEVETGWAEGS